MCVRERKLPNKEVVKLINDYMTEQVQGTIE